MMDANLDLSEEEGVREAVWEDLKELEISIFRIGGKEGREDD